MLVQYLVTTCSKSKKEIEEIVLSLNIRGELLIGNQLCDKNDDYSIKIGQSFARVYNLTSRGVSKNRNFLIKMASAKYIIFMDDDVSYINDCQTYVESILSNNDKYNCIRFNVLSTNPERAIPQINKNGYIKFRQLTSFGVWGQFFNRTFLINNNILFREEIGPGTENNHGEDAIFNHDFLKHSKIYQFKRPVFSANQSDSTWHGSDRNIENETISHGYNYYVLYGWRSKYLAVAFVFTHMWCYPKGTKRLTLIKYMFKGIKKAKDYYKNV